VRPKELMATAERIGTPIAERLGLALLEVKWFNERGRNVMRFIIDRRGGVSIDDCEAMSLAVEPKLDAELDEHIRGEWALEVSSPGIDRPLKTRADFERHAGSQVELRLYRAQDGNKVFTGELVGMNDADEIVLKTAEGETLSFTKEDVRIVKRTIIF